jgi:hypothetical protein
MQTTQESSEAKGRETERGGVRVTQNIALHYREHEATLLVKSILSEDIFISVQQNISFYVLSVT